jgi:hypothetical protein
MTPISRSEYLAPDHLPAVSQLRELVAPDRLVLLPDQLVERDGEMIAGFRQDAQALRVRAMEAEINVELVLPDGAKSGIYSEHDADWVLPLILSVPGGAIGTLVANEVQRLLDAWREKGGASSHPTLRYREVVLSADDSEAKVVEIEGPAEDVIQVLRERAALPRGDDDR